MPETTTRQPRGLAALFLTEMWERFSYYGMRALLVLYLVEGLKWTQSNASLLYGFYTGSVWLTPIVGGWLADRYLGAQKALLIGGTIIAAGHFVLAIETMPTFYLGLTLVALGTGLFKPNVSACVGELYEPGDARRDPGFTIFYMGINLGALFGPLVTGWLRFHYGWRYGFAAAGVGMILSVVVLMMTRRRLLGEAGLYPGKQRAVREHEASAEGKLTRDEWERVIALAAVSFFVMFFWAAYEQAGNTMNLFAAQKTKLDLGWIHVVPEWFQSVDPVFVLLLGPLFAMLWTGLARSGKEPSTTKKLAIGLVTMGLGFAFMVAGAAQAKAGLASPWWLVLAYMFHAAGELCCSPVGLSLVTKVAPAKILSLMMGVWFLSNWGGNIMAGILGTFMNRFQDPVTFWVILLAFPVVAGLVLFAVAPKLQALMHGRG